MKDRADLQRLVELIDGKLQMLPCFDASDRDSWGARKSAYGKIIDGLVEHESGLVHSGPGFDFRMRLAGIEVRSVISPSLLLHCWLDAARKEIGHSAAAVSEKTDELNSTAFFEAIVQPSLTDEERIRDIIREELRAELVFLNRLMDREAFEARARRVNRLAAWDHSFGREPRADNDAAISSARPSQSSNSPAHSERREDSISRIQLDRSVSDSACSTASGDTSRPAAFNATATTSACITQSSAERSHPSLRLLIKVFSVAKRAICRESRWGGKRS